MRRTVLMRIILIVGSILIIGGVSVMGWLLSKDSDGNMIDINLKQGETEVIEFESLCLVPGEFCEYMVTLKNGDATKYDLKLNFKETAEGTLKNFARVRMELAGEVICDELLATVFEGATIAAPVDFITNKNAELKIVYYLPLNVGNEAKNAEAIFDLMLSVSNE